MKLAYDATTLATLIKTHQVTSFELVEQALAKINATNKTLNAVTHLRTQAALNEARAYDRIASKRPFAGVPILLKDLGQDLTGLASTSGSKLFKNNIAQTTDNFVQAIINAGFIILGNTNTPEFGFKNITDPMLTGPTRNPWNPAYYSGGSSGGAASAVAADFVSIATASDGGGSIRIPASFSGLIGLKPTRGRTPVGPNGWRGWQGASISFGLTRSIKDTANLLDCLQTYQPAAPFSTPLFTAGFSNILTTKLPANFSVAYSLKSPVNTPVSDAAITAVLTAVDFLKHHGITTVEIDNPLDGPTMMESYYIVNGGETATMFANIEASLNRPLTIDDMELTTWSIYQAGLPLTAVDYSTTLATWDHASFIMDKFLQKYDLFLTPTTATTAPKITGQPLMSSATIDKMLHVTNLNKQARLDLVSEFFADSLALTPFTQQANLTGQPAISLPTAIAPNGLPLGIQFTARKGREDLLLQIGQLFECENQFNLLYSNNI
ncbi:amidase [Periweissella fabaria]|uniref:6-aminohexanoate-cyclic-dimer hydrolase n=1 Tax=Periweissella fabaria TaxID=546157 RepID=A0ABM8Z5N0_9LACO|nr:amidase [Periweissella fabaria]MCM0598059.1 amidase [Periweissella fabaria]CAH0416677.1 6-aminohexanoate-cyclic-dimer hydrolase [Periweissella fabaria]